MPRLYTKEDIEAVAEEIAESLHNMSGDNKRGRMAAIIATYLRSRGKPINGEACGTE